MRGKGAQCASLTSRGSCRANKSKKSAIRPTGVGTKEFFFFVKSKTGSAGSKLRSGRRPEHSALQRRPTQVLGREAGSVNSPAGQSREVGKEAHVCPARMVLTGAPTPATSTLPAALTARPSSLSSAGQWPSSGRPGPMENPGGGRWAPSRAPRRKGHSRPPSDFLTEKLKT